MIEDLLLPLVCERYRTDPAYREGHRKIIAPKPGTVILGLHTPEMKLVAKSLARREDWRETLNAFAQENGSAGQLGSDSEQRLSHDERMVWGLMLDYIICPLEERLRHVDAFIPSIDNWAICDNFCCNAKWLAKLTRPLKKDSASYSAPIQKRLAEIEEKEAVWRWMEGHFAAREEFRRRVPIVLALAYFLGPDDIDRTLAAMAGLGLQEGEPYYIQMAVAWLLATALARDPDKTRSFVNACIADGTLPGDIVKRYVRKARESRITRDIPAL